MGRKFKRFGIESKVKNFSRCLIGCRRVFGRLNLLSVNVQYKWTPLATSDS